MTELPRYFRYPREDVVALVPGTCRRILDVGCAAGSVGRALEARQPCEVVGIERDPRAAAEARLHLDRVVEADLDDPRADWQALLEEQTFDCVIYADVLEHLREPWSLLARQRVLVEPNATVIVSVPNVRHYPVVLGLLAGEWRYRDEGVLDRSHLRFFTRDSARELVAGSGYHVEAVRGEVFASRAARALGVLSFGTLRDFLVRQYLVVGSAGPLDETP